MDGRTGVRWAPGGKGAIMQGAKGREGKGTWAQAVLLEGCRGVTLQGWGQQSTGRAEQPPPCLLLGEGNGAVGFVKLPVGLEGAWWVLAVILGRRAAVTASAPAGSSVPFVLDSRKSDKDLIKPWV